MRRTAYLITVILFSVTISVFAGCGKADSDSDAEKKPVVQTLDIQPDDSSESANSDSETSDDSSSPAIKGPDED